MPPAPYPVFRGDTCYMNEKTQGRENRILSLVLSGVCIAASLFHIFIAWDTSISIVQQRVFHVFIMILIYFLMQTEKAQKEGKRLGLLYGALSLAAAVVGGYFLANTTLEALLKRGISGTTDLDVAMGVILIVAVMYMAWRTVGWALTALSAIFIGYAMAGPYMPEIRQGDILFLEDTEKFAAHAERYFSWLKLCGVFRRAGGLILGKHRQFDSQGTGRTPAQILLEVIGQPDFPILADFDCCHTVPMLTLPLGKRVQLDGDSQTVTLLE